MSTALALAALLWTAAPTPELADYDTLWDRRDTPGATEALDHLAAAYASTNDPAKLWRAARWYLWTSEDDLDPKRQHSNAQLGIRAGEKGVKIDPHCVPCAYWGALNVGVYGLGLNIFAALFEGIEGKFRNPIEAAAASDPTHQNPDLDYVGPQKALGRYYYKLPWPKRSLSKSREQLELAVAARPDDLHARFFFVETLLAMGDQKTARLQLTQILQATPVYDIPDAKRVKLAAEALAKKLGLPSHQVRANE